jgi:hypothetical protein
VYLRAPSGADDGTFVVDLDSAELHDDGDGPHAR